ncbi:hypothetical protein O6H91_05G078000 [Diphasiastrum complanatum]|uniref:Uncharacterized protein n=2 Tax=Diphasiastrum complanatum TaxID=34168 RepID=A0ACC2DPU7_DIPCM|nr:hypothetical protein O6H91_05G078000 [Diphasiastrum complanatum]KAJ7556304.1 hypothetical protein O6H91_05G078000 [Diphasiastrum complanatum]
MHRAPETGMYRGVDDYEFYRSPGIGKHAEMNENYKVSHNLGPHAFTDNSEMLQSMQLAHYREPQPDGRIRAPPFLPLRESEGRKYVQAPVSGFFRTTERGTKVLPRYQTVVFRVQIHCDECIKKVKRSLVKLEGVDSISIDIKLKKVTVSGNIDAQEVMKKVQKTGKCVELLSSSKDLGNKPLPIEQQHVAVNNNLEKQRPKPEFNQITPNMSADRVPNISADRVPNINADRVKPQLTYPASRDDGSYLFSDENANNCSIM